VTQIKRLALLLAVGACQKASPAAPPPPEVTVLTVQSQTVPAKFEWVAEAAASKSVEVRAQVSGVVVARPYIEGTDVKKGTVLFRIDPRTYEANYQSAQARVVQARATLGNAERNLARLKPLLAERAVAQKDVDDAQTAVEQGQAALQDAEAALRAAKKNYDDTFVRAQIDGRAGRALMVLGALVAGPSDLLTMVEQVDPIYVLFSPSDQQVLTWRRDIASKRLIIPPGVLDVQSTFSDGSVFGYRGKLNFIDIALQPSTGALQLRAPIGIEEKAAAGELCRPNEIDQSQFFAQLDVRFGLKWKFWLFTPSAHFSVVRRGLSNWHAGMWKVRQLFQNHVASKFGDCGIRIQLFDALTPIPNFGFSFFSFIRFFLTD